jgi:hypothetical protein
VLSVVRELGGAEKTVRAQRGRLRVHEFEGRHGGVGMWCDMPVQMFAAGFQKRDLLRAENK